MNIDERIEALTRNLKRLSPDREKVHQDIKLLLATAQQDGEKIRALARIAEAR
jgi:prefoldin subunit 5